MKTVKSNNQLKGSFFCISASIIWGLSFVAQSVGMEKVETFTYNGIRMMLGSAVLLPFVIRNYKKSKSEFTPVEMKARLRTFLKGGTACGLLLFAGSSLQQQAFKYLEVGKVGFITAFYMILVPILGLIFFKMRARLNAWLGVAVAMVGLYLLCLSGKGGISTFGTGEIITLIGAVAFAMHILVVDRFAPSVDGVSLSCAQFFVTGVISIICMAIFETPSMSAIISVAPALLYSGIMSSGVAFTFQIFGQKYTEPAIASLLLSLESVFSVLFGWLLLKQELSTRELAGCAVMFAAIILAQLSPKKRSENIV